MTTTPPPVCTLPKMEIPERDYDDWWFSSLMVMLMEQLVSFIDDETLAVFGKLLKGGGGGDATKAVKETAFQNGIAIAIFVVLLIAAFSTLFAIFGCCIKRCCCSKYKPGVKPTTCQKVWTLVSFGISLFICALGVALFLISLGHVRSGVEYFPKQIDSTSKQVGTFVDVYGSNLECTFMEKKKILDSKLDAAVNKIDIAINNHVKKFDVSDVLDDINVNLADCHQGLENVETKFQAMHLANPPQLAAAKKEIEDAQASPTLTGFPATFANLETKVREQKKDILEQKNKVSNMVADQHNALKTVIKTIRVKVVDMQRMVKMAVTQKNLSAEISFYLQFIMIIPIFLICIVGAGFAFLTLRFFSSLSKKKREHKNGVTLTIASGMLGCGGYMSMVTAFLLFLLSAFCFVLALIALFFCVTLFKDPELRLLGHLPGLNHQAKVSNIDIKVSVHDTMINCRNDYTFFDAIDGSKIMARETLKKDLRDLRTTDDMEKYVRRPVVNDTQAKEVKDLEGKLEVHITELTKFKNNAPVAKNELDAVIKDFEKLSTNIKLLNKKIEVVRSRSSRDDFILAVEDNFKEMEKAIVDAVADFIKMLLDLSPQCDNLMGIWDHVGAYACNHIADPVQALWISLVICGVGALTAVCQLFKSTKFLRDIEISSAEKAKSGKKTKSKSKSEKKPETPEKDTMADELKNTETARETPEPEAPTKEDAYGIQKAAATQEDADQAKDATVPEIEPTAATEKSEVKPPSQKSAAKSGPPPSEPKSKPQ